MKKTLITFIPILLIIISCGGSPKPVTIIGITLDQAIKEACIEIDTKIGKGLKIAPVNFNSKSIDFSSYVLDEVTANLVTTGQLEVIDRTEIELRRNELNFQMSGEVSDASMQGLGQTLGAQSIITGSLTDIGGTYRIVIRVLNVGTGKVEVMYRNDIANDNRVIALLGNSSSVGPVTATGKNTTNSSSSQSVEQSTQSRSYEIGDDGPAGGIIFYDKGKFTDGWRYLEYAPENFRSAYWGPYGVNITGTETGIGTGKKNTDLIVRVLNRRGDKGMAAQLCSEYTFNGYNDWFLPSKEELHLLYTYVQNNFKYELDRFGFYGWFYSSSQFDDTQAWGHVFDNGYQGGYRKNISGGYVRAVRAF